MAGFVPRSPLIAFCLTIVGFARNLTTCRNSDLQTLGIHWKFKAYNFPSASLSGPLKFWYKKCNRCIIQIISLFQSQRSPILLAVQESYVEKHGHLWKRSPDLSSSWLLHKIESSGQPFHVPWNETVYSTREHSLENTTDGVALFSPTLPNTSRPIWQRGDEHFHAAK